MFPFFKQQYLFIYWYGHTLHEKHRRPRYQYITRRKKDKLIRIIVGWCVINVTAAADISRAPASE